MPKYTFTNVETLQQEFAIAAKDAGVTINPKAYACAFTENGSVENMALVDASGAGFDLVKGADLALVRLVLPKTFLDGTKPLKFASGFYVVNVKMDPNGTKAVGTLRTPQGKSVGTTPGIVEVASGKLVGAPPMIMLGPSVHSNPCSFQIDWTFPRVTVRLKFDFC